MPRSCFALLVLAAFWAICGCTFHEEAETPESAAGRPNILLVIADDWSWPHTSAYGDSVVQTPTFDRIARDGVLFNHAYVASPSCTPSRAAILTGQWHWRLKESANLWSTLQADIPVYPEILENAGYDVGFSGKGWGPGRPEPGGRKRNPAGSHFDSFEEFLKQRSEDRPFCFWYGSRNPHRPYQEGSGMRRGIRPELGMGFPWFPDSREIQNDIADYYAEVQDFDHEVKGLLESLAESGELDRTLFAVTSDNGMPFPRCKANLYDSGVRVPLAVCWPDQIKAGRNSDDLVSLIDLAPTFLEAAGVPAPSAMTGRSLMRILVPTDTEEIAPVRDFVLSGKERHVPCQEGRDSGGTPMRAIRTRDFLYIRNFRPDRWPAGTPNFEAAFFPNSWYGDVDNGPTKLYMTHHQDRDAHHKRLFELAFAKRPQEELYDLRLDPDQLKNRADDPVYADAKRELADRLMEHLRETGDPRLLGGGDLFDHYPYYGGSPLKPE